VAPGTDQYVLGVPLFKKVVLELTNGKRITINANNNNESNRYIFGLKVNGISYTKNWLSHETLLQGASLDFDMSAKPNKTRGVAKEDAPYSFSSEK
jgi:putative alpha-1,2-mannosidase